MSQVIEVEVDLAGYENEIRDYLNGSIKEDLQEYVKELEKELYFCSRKSDITVEKIYEDLRRILEEN